MLIDTGSEWTWLPSDRCKDCLVSINEIDGATSSRLTVDQNPVRIDYYHGSVVGRMAYANFRISSEKDKLASPQGASSFQLKFLLADQKDHMRNMKSEGLLGLGPLNGSADKSMPLNPFFAGAQ